MGIKKGLLSYIKKKYPSVIKQSFISEFEGKTIAVDIFSFLYRYIHSFGKEDNKWLISMFKHFYVFKKYNINAIPIFDGKPPVEKNEERLFRKEKKDQEDIKITNIINDFNIYIESGEVSALLNDTNNFLIRKKQQLSLFKSKLFKPSDKPKIDVFELQNYINSLKNRCNYLSKQDINIVKELFDIVGIPYIQAIDEAETLACYMMNNKLCDNIISLDSDCIAYGIDSFIIDINQRGNCTVFDVKEFQKVTGMTRDQITDLCIICQCDYNSFGNGIEGVGPARAINLLKQYNDIEGVLSHGYDEDNLNFVRCREIFRSEYTEMDDMIRRLIFYKKVDMKDLEEFSKIRNVNINIRDFENSWVRGSY